MLLLHVYHPERRAEDQKATWAALWAIEQYAAFPVVHWPTTGPDGYWQALEAVWGYAGPVVVLEQDIVPSIWHIDQLLRCGEEYCAWDFRLAHGVLWYTLEGGHGFGLAKFSVGRRGNIVPRPQVPHVPWPDTVPALHERLAPVHVHTPPIEHHHGDA